MQLDEPAEPALAGKVAVVTGAGRGIGRAVAMAMAAQGARVVVNDAGAAIDGAVDCRADCAVDVVREIRSAGGEAVAHVESIATPQGAASLIQCAQDTWGRIDAVVNNAGILRDGLFHKMSVEDWRAVLDVHLNGSFLVARAAAVPFREQQAGAYVFMTSTSGLVGSLGQANYAAAKMGIAGLSRSIAIDMARFNVRSNCIAPWAHTRMIEAIPADTPGQRTTHERMRAIEPQHVAPLAVFLASDLAASVTGQILGMRANELFLFSQPRPVRSIHSAQGWTSRGIAAHALPALRHQFIPLETSEDFFCWDPL
jgi:NAD(P)-dependent dehydrogenase (short-subunit alcohol dehydrogenase family)